MKAHLLQADGLAAVALARSVRNFVHRRPVQGLRVLDLGCGTMPYRAMFTEGGAGYVGADIDGSPDIRIPAEGSVPVADQSVDAVVSFQVLEHVRNVPQYLFEARRVLNPDGRLFLSTHGVWPYHPHPTDFWRWTRDGLQAQIEDAGFRIERVSALCGPAAWISMFPMLALKKLLGPVAAVMMPANLIVNLLAGAADLLTPASLRETNAAIYAVEAVRAP